MFNAETIEIVIGLVFFYLLLSLLMTTINELISGALSLRGKQMRKAIGEMLGSEYGRLFYNHPLIGELGTSKWKVIRYLQESIPSYMRASAFSQVVVDVIKQEFATKRSIAMSLLPKTIKIEQAESANEPSEIAKTSVEDINSMTLAQLNTFIEGKREENRRKGSNLEMAMAPEENKTDSQTRVSDDLAPFSEAAEIDLSQLQETIKSMGFPEKTMSIILNLAKSVDGDIDLFKKKLEEWFDAKMERVTGWYVRQMRWITLGGAFVIAVALNADTFFIVEKLATDSEARASMVTSAIQYAATVAPKFEKGTTSSQQDQDTGKPIGTRSTAEGDSLALKKIDTLMQRVDTLVNQNIKYASQTLGLGWSKLTSATNPDYCDCEHTFWCYLKKFAGWLITAIAISLGAPFWFDMLKKLISIRSAGINPDETSKATKKTVG